MGHSFPLGYTGSVAIGSQPQVPTTFCIRYLTFNLNNSHVPDAVIVRVNTASLQDRKFIRPLGILKRTAQLITKHHYPNHLPHLPPFLANPRVGIIAVLVPVPPGLGMQVIEIAKAPVVSRNFPGQDIWETALGRFTDTLNDEQKRRIGTVTSLEELIGRVEKLQKQYAAGTGSRWFDKLAPVLTWLTGFNHCVHSFVQASPPEFALVWGALSLVLEVTPPFKTNPLTFPLGASLTRSFPPRSLPSISVDWSKWSRLSSLPAACCHDLESTPASYTTDSRVPRSRRAWSRSLWSSLASARTPSPSSHVLG